MILRFPGNQRVISQPGSSAPRKLEFRMKVVFLGTGTSSGVPVIACDCPVCTSSDPRNKRRRTNLYVVAGGTHIIIDTPPDFREQALTFRIPRVNGVLITHSHADHIFGLDDIRRYNTIQRSAIPVYAGPATIRDLNRVFDYVRNPLLPEGTFRPNLDFTEVTGEFRIGSVAILPLVVVHGIAETLGFRLECEGRTLGYVPDCREMSEEIVGKLAGVDVMILDALRHRPHVTHLTVTESVETLRRIGARRSFLIHMCHDLDHEETQKSLPVSVEVSWDGLVVEW